MSGRRARERRIIPRPIRRAQAAAERRARAARRMRAMWRKAQDKLYRSAAAFGRTRWIEQRLTAPAKPWSEYEVTFSL